MTFIMGVHLKHQEQYALHTRNYTDKAQEAKVLRGGNSEKLV